MHECEGAKNTDLHGAGDRRQRVAAHELRQQAEHVLRRAAGEPAFRRVHLDRADAGKSADRQIGAGTQFRLATSAMNTSGPSAPPPHGRDDDHVRPGALWRLAPQWLAAVWASYVARKGPKPPDAPPAGPSLG